MDIAEAFNSVSTLILVVLMVWTSINIIKEKLNQLWIGILLLTSKKQYELDVLTQLKKHLPIEGDE